jgi:hypothetical protein
MSSFTSALVTAGPKAIHPWGDRGWRIALSAQHVTGSSSDYWLVTPTPPPSHPVVSQFVSIPDPSHNGLVDSLVFALALHLGDEQVEGYLLDHHNVSIEGGVRVPVLGTHRGHASLSCRSSRKLRPPRCHYSGRRLPSRSRCGR